MASIAVIGGGVAGLSAGIYALLNGHSATVYERHFRSGGNLTCWDRKGYHIDNCIHWLTGTNPLSHLYRMWEDLGVLGDAPIYQPDTLYTFERNGERLSLDKELWRLEADMLRLSPEDKKEIRSFLKAVRAFQRLNGMAGRDCTRRATGIEKLLGLPHILKYRDLTTGDLAKRFKHPLLSGFIESLMTDYFSSLALIMVFATFTSGNGAIPVGASCAMAERLEKRFLQLGGALRLQKGVAKINVNGETATSLTLEDGATEAADYVVIATDPAMAFGKLLDKRYMPKGLLEQYNDPDFSRFSSYHCAFSCDTADLPFRSDVIFEIPERYKQALHSEYLMVREFSHEKGFAPEGKNILQTMVYCREDVAREFISLREDKEAYLAEKARIAEVLCEIIAEKFPTLRDKLACLDVWTPATYRRYVDSEIGSWMSFAFPSGRLPKTLPAKIDGLDNVFLGTQWLQAPGGLPIAAACGRRAIEAIVKKEKRKTV